MRQEQTDTSFCLIQHSPNVKFSHKIPFTNLLIHCPLPISKTGAIALRWCGDRTEEGQLWGFPLIHEWADSLVGPIQTGKRRARLVMMGRVRGRETHPPKKMRNSGDKRPIIHLLSPNMSANVKQRQSW